MSNEKHTAEPLSLKHVEGERFFNTAWVHPIPPSDCSIEERMLWLQVAACKGMYEKGIFSKKDGPGLRENVANAYVELTPMKKSRENVFAALSLLQTCEDPDIRQIVLEVMEGFPILPLRWDSKEDKS